ncbi:hypothetical protein Taro_033109 [Colocasia esculenta]|uniref:Peptidase C14 caspase domain-containing protein n=1 Tax=Colocasia esculenta TaxID=4460 RepID=A0A843W0T2_COLES|nr:hypothetical protein [Colocasia esculenta]
MAAAMQWLVQGCRSGDSLFFHFSGHGSQRMDINSDELDGFDETLCPLDYEINGMISDDEIHTTIVEPLPTGVKLHAVIDACHSGSSLDLPYLCKLHRNGFWQWEVHSKKETSGGIAICFSGCDDDQTSSDTSAFTREIMTGAMTYCFIQAVESEPGVTYGRILQSMRSAIREASTGIRVGGPIASLLGKVFQIGLTQVVVARAGKMGGEDCMLPISILFLHVPQLSSSLKFNIFQEKFIL